MPPELPIDTTNRPPPGRLRFSLRELLLVVGATCLAASTVVAIRESRRLHEENQQLRDELGRLTIADTNKLHVIAGQDIGDDHWRWRVYVPTGNQFALYCRRAKSIEDDAPTWCSGPLTPGEYSLTALVRRATPRQWNLRLGYARQVASLSFDDASAPRFPNDGPVIIQGCVGRTVVLASAQGSRVDLLAEIDSEATLFGGTVDHPGPGFRLWLEPFAR
jgi:hypothetical protein